MNWTRHHDVPTFFLLVLNIVHLIVIASQWSAASLHFPMSIVAAAQAGALGLVFKTAYDAAGRPSSASVIRVAMVSLTNCTFGAVTGMREAVVLPLVAALAGCMLAIARPWPLMIAAALSIPLGLQLTFWNEANRKDLWFGGQSTSLTNRLETIFRNSIQELSAEVENDPAITRLVTVIPMMRTLDLIRDHEGFTLWEGMATPLIPRAFWPEKPLKPFSQELHQRFSRWRDPNATSSASAGQPAEAYMYAGWPGVILIGFALGAVASALSAACELARVSRRPAMLGLQTAVALIFLKCEGQLAWPFVGAVWSTFLLIFALFTASFLSGRQAAQGPR